MTAASKHMSELARAEDESALVVLVQHQTSGQLCLEVHDKTAGGLIGYVIDEDDSDLEALGRAILTAKGVAL